jgi:nitrate reductase NapAB chaperone NapD
MHLVTLVLLLAQMELMQMITEMFVVIAVVLVYYAQDQQQIVNYVIPHTTY